MMFFERLRKKLKVEHKNNRATTIRFMFPLMLGTVAILFANIISTDKSYIRLVPSETMVMSGEDFTIDVFVNAHVPVNAINVNIGFSSEMVDILNINTGNSVLTIWTHEPIVEDETIKFSGGTFKRGFLGEHLIGTIKARAKYTGNTEFFINNAELLAGDGKGSSVAIDNSNTKTSFYFYDQNDDPAKISAEVRVNINADIDGDGNVTLRDISTFISNWTSKQTLYDFNSDGRMNFIDFSIILSKSFFDLTS
jgi:hypothetical protein